MIIALRVLFSIILLTMIAVTSWASTQCAIWQIPEVVLKHSWFVATMFDAYFGFLTFYCWLFYKESSPMLRVTWFVSIILLGNMAMAAYMLIQLFKLKANASVRELLLREGPGG